MYIAPEFAPPAILELLELLFADEEELLEEELKEELEELTDEVLLGGVKHTKAASYCYLDRGF